MKTSIQLYRVIRFPTDLLLAAVDLKTEDNCCGYSVDLQRALSKRYGPMSPRFKIFWTETFLPSLITAGIQVMGFELTEPNVPQSGMIHANPIVKEEVLLADGVLMGELERLGIYVDAKTIDWCAMYEVK